MTSTEVACVALPSPSHRPTPPSCLVEEYRLPVVKAQQDTATTPALASDEDGVESRLAEWLITAFERLISVKAVANTASASEATKAPSKEGNSQATKLEYKRVDEVYALTPQARIMADSVTAGTRKHASTRLSSRQILAINLINACLSFGTESVSLSFIMFLRLLTGFQIRIPRTRLPSWISSPHYYEISCEKSARIFVASP